MRRIFLFSVLVPFLFMLHLELVNAQGYSTKPYTALEIYAGIGSTNYFGDVGGKSGKLRGVMGLIDGQDIDLDQTRYAGTLGFRYIYNKVLSVNLQLMPLLLSGSDANSVFADAGRSYSFQSYLMNFSLSSEFFIANRLTGAAPYILFGVGGAFFNAKFYDQSDENGWVNRYHPYGVGVDNWIWTGVDFTSVFSTGFGVRFPANNKKGLSHNIELRFNYCLKDMIDGYSIDTKIPSNPKIGQIGDTFLVLSYQLILDLDKTFVYDHKGRINR